METLLICLFIAMLLPYLAKAPVAYAQVKMGRYDNHHPRAQQAKLTGFGARALAAHQNEFEALLIFSISVLAVMASQSANDSAAMFAIGYLVSRVAFQLLYLFDFSSLRSLSWFVGFGCSLGVFWQAF
ncbi:MAG: MAPEG family protein [Parashewanella sp.]